jgi:hypothetical protein
MRQDEDYERDIVQLREATSRTRLQFLQTEVQACLTGLDIAKFSLSVGSMDVVQREISMLEKGIGTIEHFLPQLPPEQRTELDAALVELKRLFAELKSQVESASSGE